MKSNGSRLGPGRCLLAGMSTACVLAWGGCMGVVEEGASSAESPGGQPPQAPGVSALRPDSPITTPGAPVTSPGVEVAPSKDACKAGPSAPVADLTPRRLGKREYNNTIQALFGDETSPAEGFPADSIQLGFVNNAELTLEITPVLAESYIQAARGVAERAATKEARGLSTCTSSGGESQCVREYVSSLGRRAFRRPLEPDEVTGLANVFAQGKALGGNAEGGVRAVIEAMLISPSFLYRVEAGAANGPAASYQMASRLSYLIIGSMPDAELFAAAEASRLSSPAEVAAQARRLMALPAARETVKDFYRYWLQLDLLAEVAKTPAEAPGFAPAHLTAMRRETETFVENVYFEGDGRLSTALLGGFSYPNRQLASGYYGMTRDLPPDDGSFVRTPLDPQRRPGLLTHASILTVHSSAHPSVFRGKFLYDQMFCSELPGPPPGALIEEPTRKPGETGRQWDARIADMSACASCHRPMSHVGFAFEHYDGVGRWRDTDQGAPVDDSAEILGIEGLSGSFRGARALSERLATSERVHDCITRQWFRYMAGRRETAEDACTLGLMKARFAGSQQDVRTLLLEYVSSPAFMAAGKP